MIEVCSLSTLRCRRASLQLVPTPPNTQLVQSGIVEDMVAFAGKDAEMESLSYDFNGVMASPDSRTGISPGFYWVADPRIARKWDLPEPGHGLFLVHAGGSASWWPLSCFRAFNSLQFPSDVSWEEGEHGNLGNSIKQLRLEDGVLSSGNLVQIEHHANGSGSPTGQTFGIDIHNYRGARQALVIHQYSAEREAVRIDNTDENASVYINNTENRNYNPGRGGRDAPFLKLHPFNMGNFAAFAYLLDDLTFLDDGTEKGWKFRTTTLGAPIVEFVDADGRTVASISQDGDFVSSEMSALKRRVAHLETQIERLQGSN